VSELMQGILISGLFSLTAALIGVTYQFYQWRAEVKTRADDAKRERKLEIISNLVSYRYVLIPGHATPAGKNEFNAALNAIPVHFIENKAVIDRYRTISESFDDEAFHRLVMEMLRATTTIPPHLDRQLLTKVPSVNVDIVG